MPPIAREPSIYPTQLLDGFTASDSERCWWAVYTRARQEKATVRSLIAQRIPCYLPLVQRDSVVGRRRVRSFHPVFGGYVFLFGNDDERVSVKQTNRISQVFPVPDPGQLEGDLRRVRDLIASDAPLTMERRLEPGRLVRIKSGSLAGLEGTIIQRRNTTRVLIAVKYLQQGISVQIDDYMVEPI